MLKICVLEDEAAQMERMKAYLQKFQSEHADFEYILDAYKNAFDLLEHYKRDVDLLFSRHSCAGHERDGSCPPHS